MWHIVLDLVILTVAVLAVARLLPGITLKTPGTAVLVAVVYSVVDFFLFKLLSFLSFPFILVTFGLFVFIINAALLWLTDQLVEDFHIRDLPTTLLASLLISMVKWLLVVIIYN